MRYILDTPVNGLIGEQKYQTQMNWRNGKFITDEPERLGGMDIGPDPFTLLFSSLITCTLVTLRMYIDHKRYHIPEISARANMDYQMDNTDHKIIIERQIEFNQSLDPEISDRLLKIAKQCPISKILKQEVIIRTVKA